MKEIHKNKENPFYGLLTPVDAAEIWGLEQSTIRKYCTDGTFEPGKDCWKFGKQWIVTAQAMCELHKTTQKWKRYLQGGG